MSVTDTLLENNRRYAASRDRAALPGAPSKRVAIVACMDARLDVAAALGLAEGDAHVIRNAGGIVTDDVLRSLIISQRLLGTNEVVLIHHTNCGMEGVDDEKLGAAIAADTGVRPPFHLQPFPDEGLNLAADVRRIADSLFVPSKNVRGFVFDVGTGALTEVSPA